MWLSEMLDVWVGDIGRLISGALGLVEFLLGVIYYTGKILAGWLLLIGTTILEGWEVLKVIGVEVWAFGGEVLKAVLLIFYGVELIFESICIVVCDLKTFTVHVFISLTQNCQDAQDGIRHLFTEVPGHVSNSVSSSLILVGEKAIFVGQNLGGVLLDFLTQLIVAPVNAVYSILYLLSRALFIPFYLVQAVIEIPPEGKAGLLVIVSLWMLYWKISLLALPTYIWRLLCGIGSLLVRGVNIAKNSRRILQHLIRGESITESVLEGNSNTKALCVICQEETVSFIAYPCKHCCLCYTCVKALVNIDNRCPLCRGAVTKFERVYIPL